MPHRIILVYEFFVLIITAGVASAVKLLTGASQLLVMAETSNNINFDAAKADYDFTKWLLLPFIGSVLAAILLVSFRSARQKRECMPSAGFSIVGSVIFTQIVSFVLGKFSITGELIVFPHTIAGIGFILAIILYAIAEPAIKRMLDRSTKIADTAVDSIGDAVEEGLRKSKNRKNRNE